MIREFGGSVERPIAETDLHQIGDSTAPWKTLSRLVMLQGHSSQVFLGFLIFFLVLVVDVHR